MSRLLTCREVLVTPVHSYGRSRIQPFTDVFVLVTLYVSIIDDFIRESIEYLSVTELLRDLL